MCVSALCMPLAAEASSSLWAFPQSVSVSGSASMTTDSGTVAASVSWEGRSMHPSSVGTSGVTISGVASGTYTITITPADGGGACSGSGSFDNGFALAYGGADPWVGSFSVGQAKSSSEYDCEQGPYDVAATLSGLLTACGAPLLPGRPLAEQDDPMLVIDQTETGSCGSLHEHAVIHTEAVDEAAEPITGGAPLRSVTVPARVRWKAGTTKRVRVVVRTTGKGKVEVTLRSGEHVLGSRTVFASHGGALAINVPLNASAVRPLLADRASVPLTLFVAGAGAGLHRTTRLRR
jgi:hypothetical protein